LSSVSIYFFAGDFVDALRRYQEGRDQIYQTHNEVARLIHDLLGAKQKVNIYSFVTPDKRDEQPMQGLRVVSLGANNYSVRSLLSAAIEQDDAEAIIAHFPDQELLRAALATTARTIAMLACSYNRTGIRSTLNKWRIVSLLDNPRFELVSNHCLPATEQLAHMGVRREKLIAWDVARTFEPGSGGAKKLLSRARFEAVYVGSIVEDKGVAELIRAVALLRRDGLEVHCSLAGLGNIEGMQALGATLGVSDLLSFVRLLGNKEVFKMMGEADLVAVPSRTVYPEGFPLTMFEAIASRTPIVCSDHPMFREVMVDGRNASVFRSGDHQALAAAIRRTLSDPVLYAALSESAPLTWAALKGPADWRTLIFKWVVEGSQSQWISDHMLASIRPAGSRDRAPA
jgi:glycosyltransferase involved in cell wall biosynthesis